MRGACAPAPKLMRGSNLRLQLYLRLRLRLSAFACAAGLAACAGDDQIVIQPRPLDDVRLNEIQVLGTHNSYHIAPAPALLSAIAAFLPDLAATLEYSALPLEAQLDLGVRQLELDVFADPEGGRYARRAGLAAIGQDPESGLAELAQPGLKVLHTPDLDFDTHCLSFTGCLAVVKAWSDAHPGHIPIMIMIETKQEPIPDLLGLGFAVPLPFGAAELDDIDREIRAVFAPEQLIVPDDIRGGRASLEAVLLEQGWPTLGQARGRVLFTLLHGGEIRDAYVAGHPALAERVMFVTSDPGTPEAGFFNRNSALAAGAEIDALVKAGYLVRTRADIDTLQARSGDTALRDAAFASGAQFVSTDYVEPDPDWRTGYAARLPAGTSARCNPLIAPPGCDSSRL